MTVSTETKSKFNSKFKETATKIELIFKANQTAGVSGNCHCPAYPPPPPPPPTEEPCAPSYKSGQQITPNSDRNCKEGNPNSSPGATEKSKNTHAGARANADDDDELDGEQKDRAFDGERSSERSKRSSDANADADAVADVDAGSGSS